MTPTTRAGYTAYVAGNPRHANPHPAGTTAHTEWLEGWCKAARRAGHRASV